MKKLPQLLILLIIGISDAYMVSHPNILGKIGVRVYNYGLIKNFPNALITILSCIIISLLINYLLQKQVEIYQKANKTMSSFKVIIYFTKEEHERVIAILIFDRF